MKGGFFASLALGAFVACGGGTTGVASKYVKSVSVGAEGATIHIASSDDPTIAGTSITIPAHALAANTTISIGVSSVDVALKASGHATAIGPVVDFEPSGTKFAVPVTVTLPVTLTGKSSASHVLVEAVEGDGSARAISASYAGGLATFHVSGFTSFGGIAMGADAGSCSADSDCASGEVCVSGSCTVVAECATDADCPSGESCVSGTCSASASCTTDADCPVREVCVAGSCTVPTNSCASDSDCPSGEVCIGGSCSTASDGGPFDGGGFDGSSSDGGGADASCTSGLTDCGGVCVDTNTDSNNCGECRAACPSGQTCSAGTCS